MSDSTRLNTNLANTIIGNDATEVMTKSDGNAKSECNFWELISDVAKDLDLALQDLSPDFEISADIDNGITRNGRSSVVLSSLKGSDPILLESTIVRTAGDDNAEKDDDRTEREDSSLSLETPLHFDEVSVDSPPPSPPSPAPPLPIVPSSVTSKSSSYSTQLLMVMGKNSCSNLQSIQCNDKQLFNRVTPSPASCSSVEPKSSMKDNSGGDDDANSGSSNESIPASIGLLERLMRTHPIWFLPEISRAGVVHLLQGKDHGSFIIRQSSKPNTMALSVRLPEGRGPHVEHYLIEDAGNGKLHLEGSDNHFSAIPMLVCHYCQCCDELPVQLTLPKVLSQSSRQQLTSLALLGQDFWQSLLSKPTNVIDSDNNSSSSNSTSRYPLTTFTGQQNGSIVPLLKTSPLHIIADDLNPMIDVKKSSTVPIAVVMAQQATPKLPPRSVQPPPIPPRTTKLLMKLSQQQSALTPTVADKLNDSVTITVSSNENATSVAPNTEVTLIDISNTTNVKRISTDSSNVSVESQINYDRRQLLNEEKPHNRVKCYRSSLADKVSDYEDIWGATTSSKLTLSSTLDDVPEKESKISDSHQMGTQTDDCAVSKRKSECTFSSPFYSEPIDAIKSNGTTFRRTQLRRSDTDLNNSGLIRPSVLGYSLESLIDSLKCHSLYIDTCTQLINAKNPHLQDAAIQVGNSAVSKSRHNREMSWPIDQTWEWLHNGIALPFRRHLIDDHRRSTVESTKSDITTIEDLILLKSPELTVEKTKSLTAANLNSLAQSNVDADMNYDNLAIYRNGNINDDNRHPSLNTDTDTEFSEPWDSEWWECLLKKVFPRNALFQLSPDSDETTINVGSLRVLQNDANSSATSLSCSRRTSAFDMTEGSTISEAPSVASVNNNRQSINSNRPTVVENSHDNIGANISNYVFKLASEGNNTFAKAINHFIQCTIESSELNPTVIMRNIRQFMNGMKNYLIKNGEGKFDEMVQNEREKLKSNEFLNIDAILEGTLHKLVIKPLKNHLYELLVNEYNRNGSLKLLSKNIKEAQTKTPLEIGVRSELHPPDAKAMIVIQKHLCSLQKAYSPLKKLEYLLSAISAIYNSVHRQQMKRSRRETVISIGADDFLPIFVYVLIKCGCISLEAEADYMFGLLHPSILSGEGGYYLTALSSAVSILKNMIVASPSERSDSGTLVSDKETTVTSLSAASASASDQINSSLSTGSISTVTSHSSPFNQNGSSKLPSITDLQGYMKIIFPDELSCNIIAKTLPVRPNMTTKDVCKMIAHKFKITNPEDYGLFKLINGEENQLNDNDIPQVIKSEYSPIGVDCYFTYKRCDAKIVWPIIKLEVISPSV